MSQPVGNRREFLGSVGAAGAASLLLGAAATPASPAESEKLALDGGPPVRKTFLGVRNFGPQFYDDVEKQELVDVLNMRNPFRWSAGRASKVLAFEKAYAAWLGVKYALGVTSGTTALMTAMAALGVGPGDEVILPAWTWYACYDAVVLAGALPVFAEIDESFTIDPWDVAGKITPRTKVLMPVHLQGCPCDMDGILHVAGAHKLRVLEDCAQCVGGRYWGRPVGTLGDIGIYSFQQSKTITAGEGGALVTNDPRLFEQGFRFHDCGMLRSPYTEALGGGLLAAFAAGNVRMSEFTGAVLCGQLKKLDTICAALRRAARIVREGIADLPGLRLRKVPDPDGELGVGVFLDLGSRQRRDRFIAALGAEGISAAPPAGSVILPVDPRIEKKATVHPAWPSFQTPAGKAIRYGRECCPRTLDILGRHAGVMLDPTFRDDDLKDIIRAVRKVYLAMRPA